MSYANREGFTVRVLRSGSAASAGIGFVVGDRHIVTCAHVVNTALGRKQREQQKPGLDARVQIEFPILGDAEGAPTRSCRVEAWAPPPEHGVAGGDVAGLVLAGDRLPEGAGLARLVEPASLRDVQVAVFGYPGDPPQRTNGTWSAHRLRGAVGGGIIQLDHDSESAIRAQPGYSGSPAVVVSETGDAVIGMLAASSGDNARDAYAIPVSQLVAAWPDVLADLTVPDCPYRGLRSFTAEDADAGVFVGREDEITRLRQMVEQHPLVLVTGPSGVGKSSLVNAGLIPGLNRDAWATATFRPGATPFEALAKALLQLERPGQPLTVDDLERRVSQLRSEGLTRLGPQLAMLRGQILLSADQLEEILDPVTCPPEMRTAFLDLILNIPDSGQVRMVCTLRGDFFNQLLEHPGAGTVIQHLLFPLSPMTVEQLRRIVVEPAQIRGVRYEDGLAQRIAQEAGDGGGLPILEFALTELWPHQRGRQITWAEYQKLGGVPGALTYRAEQVFTELAAQCAEDRIRRVLLAMVRSRQGAAEATRRVATREQLGSDWPVAEKLAKQRLAVLDHDSARQQDTAELAHEALIKAWPRLRAWVDADADFRRWLTNMEERASDDDLLSEARIGEADRWLTERLDDIPREVVSLVERSKSAWLRRVTEVEEARARAEEAAHRAKEAAQQSEARRLAAAAELVIASHEESMHIPIALAVEALRMAPELEVDIVARRAIKISAREVSRLDHRDRVYTVAFNSAGSHVATGSEDGTAAIFDAVTGSEMSRTRHGDAVNAVTFSPDGLWMATASSDQSVRIIDVATGNQVCGLTHRGDVMAVVFNPDGSRVATGSADGMAQVFNVPTGESVSMLNHEGAVNAVAFSDDGLRVVTGSDDGTARVFETITGEQIWSVRHGGTVHAVAPGRVVSPWGIGQGHWRIATASRDGTARVLDAKTGDEVSRLDHSSAVMAVAFSPDGARVATAGQGDMARVFDASTGAQICRLVQGGAAYAVAFSPDSTRVAVGSRNEGARVFDASTGEELWRLEPGSAVLSVAFSPDGGRVATGGDNGSARVFDVAVDAEAWRLDHVAAAVFSPYSDRLAASDNRHLRLFDSTTGAVLRNFGLSHPKALSFDGARLASNDVDGLCVYNTTTGAKVCDLEYSGIPDAMMFSQDGTLLAATSRSDIARIFDVVSGTEVCSLHRSGPVAGLVFSPDGTRVAVGSRQEKVRVFDIASATEVCRLDHSMGVTEMVFSPDGTHIAFAGWFDGARIFDAATGTQVHCLDTSGTGWSVAFSPDGTRVATGDYDGSARVFDVTSGSEMSRLHHGGAVRTVAFSNDSTLLATGSDDGSARVFDVTSGSEMSRLDHGSAVWTVAFSRNGTRLATYSIDLSVRIWIISHDELIAQAESRLTRNLTEQEWRRFFRDEPYRKTRADLP